MDVTEAIRTRLEVREYASEQVDDETRHTILEAGRLAPSGRNLQHWRFLLVDDQGDLDQLAERSSTGGWVADADFAVVILTDPSYEYHEIDAARAADFMQFAAWEAGVGSCVFTGYDEAAMGDYLAVPDDYATPLVLGFGYPTFDVETVQGKKDRKPLTEIAFADRFDEPV